ncbi:MAG: DUF1015 domain-containing protein [Candidatus Omnitrophica bacterium]|nr:DUF1015 domain-containing protein [Candidatus Omnitrophota bacterium]
MAKIEPLQAIIYNQEKIQDLSKVVCPPYDVISPERQDFYHALSPHNFIHILLRKDVPGEDKYRRSAELFRKWSAEEIFIADKAPAVYFYVQEYILRGEKKKRYGFIARLCLEDKKSVIYGHEHTHVQAKADRLKLLREVKANLSPIFVIFKDTKRVIRFIDERYARETGPFIEVKDDEKTVHRLWRIDDPRALEAIKQKMEAESIFIADGHHRYEVACAYRREMQERLGAGTGEEGFNYVLAYFTNTDPLGLSILPIHRFVRLIDPPDPAFLAQKLKERFEVEEVKDKTRFFFMLEKAGRSEHVIGMHYRQRFWLLRLKNVKILDKVMVDKPAELRSLDVSILNCLILQDPSCIRPDEGTGIYFSPDAEELVRKIHDEPDAIAFFLNPVKVEHIMAVAAKEEKMPPKSTYFYPKVLSGMVVNRLS